MGSFKERGHCWLSLCSSAAAAAGRAPGQGGAGARRSFSASIPVPRPRAPGAGCPRGPAGERHRRRSRPRTGGAAAFRRGPLGAGRRGLRGSGSRRGCFRAPGVPRCRRRRPGGRGAGGARDRTSAWMAGAEPRPGPAPRSQPVPLRSAAAAPIGWPAPGHLHAARPLAEALPRPPRLRFTCAAECPALGARRPRPPPAPLAPRPDRAARPGCSSARPSAPDSRPCPPPLRTGTRLQPRPPAFRGRRITI